MPFDSRVHNVNAALAIVDILSDEVEWWFQSHRTIITAN